MSSFSSPSPSFGSPQSTSSFTNITTPESMTPKDTTFGSPLQFLSPSPCHETIVCSSRKASMVSMESMDSMDSMDFDMNIAIDQPLGYMQSSTPTSLSFNTPTYNNDPTLSQDYYAAPEPSLNLLDTNLQPVNYQSKQPESPSSMRSISSTSSYQNYTPYGHQRRSLPPIDATRFEEEEWYTPTGKKVRHSAMHLHCATM